MSFYFKLKAKVGVNRLSCLLKIDRKGLIEMVRVGKIVWSIAGMRVFSLLGIV